MHGLRPSLLAWGFTCSVFPVWWLRITYSHGLFFISRCTRSLATFKSSAVPTHITSWVPSTLKISNGEIILPPAEIALTSRLHFASSCAPARSAEPLRFLFKCRGLLVFFRAASAHNRAHSLLALP